MKTTLGRLLPESRFARAVSVLAGGTAGAQLVVIAASPILTRLYTPDEFGLLAVYTAILGILGVIASLRYQLAIPLPKTTEQALNILALSFFALTALTLILSVMVGFFGNRFAELLNAPRLKPYLWLVPIGFFFIGMHEMLQYWALRTRAFGLIARTKMIQSTSVAGLQIIGSSIGPLALLAGRVIGQVIGNVVLLRGINPAKLAKTKLNINLKNIACVARKYKQFPLFSSWAGLLNATGTQMPPLFFAAAFSPAAAGGYMLAQRVINMPLSVIGTAVSDAFLPTSIDGRREGRLGNQLTKLFAALASVMFPGATLLFFIAPDLFQIIFGDNWRIAGEIVRWLAPMLAIQFLINPVSRIFVTVERQDLALLFQGVLFGLRLGSLSISYGLDLSLIETVKIFCIASVSGYLMYLIAICRVVKISASLLLKNLGPSVILSILLYLACFAFYHYFSNLWSLLMCIFFGGAFLSANLLFLVKRMRLS
ncbi:MAG: oligosaccharide flippase family protein [Marinobacter adhaerens]